MIDPNANTSEMSDEQLAELNPRFPELRAKYEARQRQASAAPVRVGRVDGQPLTVSQAKEAIALGLKQYPGEFNARANEDVYRAAYPSTPERPLTDAELAQMDKRFPAMRAAYEAAHEDDDEDATGEPTLEARPALPHGYTWDEDIDAIEEQMVEYAESESQVAFWRDQLVKMLGRAHPDPEETKQVLREQWGEQAEAKLALAQRLVAQWPDTVKEALRQTGAHAYVPFINQVIRVAEARRGRR